MRLAPVHHVPHSDEPVEYRTRVYHVEPLLRGMSEVVPVCDGAMRRTAPSAVPAATPDLSRAGRGPC